MNIFGYDLDLGSLVSIIIVNLVLSGDNAVVIGLASRNLAPEVRKKAIIWGGVGAVSLRVVFTILAALILDVPLIHAVGGILLVYISYQLIKPDHDDAESSVSAADNLRGAIRTIILADFLMSLDNILAIGGAAEGHLDLLIIGLVLSIPLLLFGSTLVATVLERYPWVLILGIAVLVHAAVTMFLEDQWVERFTHLHAWTWLVIGLTPVLTLAIVAMVWVRHHTILGFGEGAVKEPKPA